FGSGFGADMAGAAAKPVPVSSLDDTHARPRASRLFRLPVAATQRGDHALAAAQRTFEHGKPDTRTLLLTDRSVFLEEAEHAIGAFQAGEARPLELPGVAQAERDRLGLRLAFEL